MNERPEWMPSESEISAAIYADQKEHESGQPNVEDLILRIGLRAVTLAKIEALESITYLFKHSDGIEELEAEIERLRKEIG